MTVITPPKSLTTHQQAALGLALLENIGPKTLHRAACHVTHPEALWNAPLSWFKQHFSETVAYKLYQAIQSVKQSDALVYCMDAIAEQGLTLLTSPKYPWTPEGCAYPALLSHIDSPPWLLFVRGHVNALSGKTLGVVGTRRMSDYGSRVVDHVIEGLAPVKPTIVSGLAAGVDGRAHQQALYHQLPTVAVFGCGIDKIFPAAHRKLAERILEGGGAWVSEYAPGVPGNKGTFPQRNRLIVGLSHGVMVVEGPRKSGSMITARLAMEENRTVFAPPANLFSPLSEGPHSLIQDGAVLTTCADDILTDLRWATPSCGLGSLDLGDSSQLSLGDPEQCSLSQTEDPLLTHIGYDPTPLDVVHQRSGLPLSELQAKLTVLELTGAIIQLPGQQVSRL